MREQGKVSEMVPESDDCFEKGDSRRVIKEYAPQFGRAEKTAVIYALYRRQKIWSQDPAKRRDEWWLLREGYCSVLTWEKWVKGAIFCGRV